MKYKSSQKFLEQMDSRAIYRSFAVRLRRLLPEQRAEVSRVLAERAERQVNANRGWYVDFCSSLDSQDYWRIENPIVK